MTECGQLAWWIMFDVTEYVWHNGIYSDGDGDAESDSDNNGDSYGNDDDGEAVITVIRARVSSLRS